MTPTAYIRTLDGFLTDMTPSVRYAGTWDCGAGNGLCADWDIPVFNPARNTRQVSSLRVINNSESQITLRVSGVTRDGASNRDTEGRALRVVGAIQPGTVRELTATELETGEGLEYSSPAPPTAPAQRSHWAVSVPPKASGGYGFGLQASWTQASLF